MKIKAPLKSSQGLAAPRQRPVAPEQTTVIEILAWVIRQYSLRECSLRSTKTFLKGTFFTGAFKISLMKN